MFLIIIQLMHARRQDVLLRDRSGRVGYRMFVWGQHHVGTLKLDTLTI